LHEIRIGTVIHVWYPYEKWFSKKNNEKILGSLLDGNRIEPMFQVPVEGKLDEISALLQHSPLISLRHLAEGTVMPYLKFTSEKFNI
jgi:hypothetical protein